MWPMLASVGMVEGLQNFYVVFRPMFVAIVMVGFSIGFGWTVRRARSHAAR